MAAFFVSRGRVLWLREESACDVPASSVCVLEISSPADINLRCLELVCLLKRSLRSKERTIFEAQAASGETNFSYCHSTEASFLMQKASRWSDFSIRCSGKIFSC